MIFLRINLPDFVQFKRYYGKSGPRVLLFKARFFKIISFVYFDSMAFVSMTASLHVIEVGTFQWIQSSSIQCTWRIITGCAATGFVNGRWQFSTPQNKHPLTDHQKIWYRWLCRRPLRLRQIWCKSVDGGLLGKWVKYNEIYFIYTFFSWTHLQVRRDDRFSRLMAQTTRTRARMCLLGV